VAIKGDELVKYIAERVITYFDTPTEIRKQAKEKVKTTREHWVYRWFGLVPFSIRMWVEQKRGAKSGQGIVPHDKKADQ
jgi:hypothetical protein